MIYGPDIVLSGMKLAPSADVYHGEETVCTYCGKPVYDGDLGKPAIFSKTFTDGSTLAARSGISCGACDAITGNDAMQFLRSYVANKDGIWSLSHDHSRVWLFMDPPEPPFVAAVVTSNIAHTAWKTPVTLSKELIYVRVDHHILRIRRQEVLKAIPICEFLAAYLEEQRQQLSTRKKVMPVKTPHRNPFRLLSRSLNKLGHGIVQTALRQSTDPLIVSHVAFLDQLSPGELWALSSMITAKNPAPQSTPIFFSHQESTSNSA